MARRPARANTLVGSDVEALARGVGEALAGRGKRGRAPELWDGLAAQRINAILMKDLSQ